MTTGIPAWQLGLAVLVTLGIYTYLYSDNKLYRALLNIMVGLGVGYQLIVMWNNVLGPLWWTPMVEGFKTHSVGMLWLLVGLLGTLWYFQFSRKYFWLSRIVIGLTLGAGAGVAFKREFLLNMPQITDSFKPFLVRQGGVPLFGSGPLPPIDWWTSFSNLVFVVTIVCVMVYFFFSFEHKAKPVKGAARAGRWLLMISFGAFFGNTVMTRMAVFLERLQFLLAVVMERLVR